MNTTDRYRAIAWTLVALVILVGLAGWIGWGRDPSSLAWMVGPAFIGEAANVGKRATFKRDAVEAERDR